MANLLLLLISCSIALFMAPVTSLKECREFCGNYGPLIQFPFWLTESWPGCGRLPEFGLRCENRTGQDRPRLIINFPDIGDFVVKDINYTKKTISINDPDGCFPKRFLHNFSLPFYPFWSSTEGNWYKFLNCSTKVPLPEKFRIDCLSNENYTVLAAVFDSLCSSSRCYGIDMVACHMFPPTYVPYQDDIQYESGFRNDFNKDIVMHWSPPGCAACESQGGTCGVNTTSYQSIGCLHSKGLSRSAMYGIIFGVGTPGLLGLIGLMCFIVRRQHQIGQQQTRPSLEFSAIAGAQPALLSVGLDGPTIESYPKTMLGESKRLPKPGDTTCSICLCEYQPNNTLRTIPDCNHYFHVDCIDEWLRLNASCPLCRNSPEPSVQEMPPSSLSVSTPIARPA